MTVTAGQRNRLILAACAALLLVMPAVGAPAPQARADEARNTPGWSILEQLVGPAEASLSRPASAGSQTIRMAFGPFVAGGGSASGFQAKAVFIASQISAILVCLSAALILFILIFSALFHQSHGCRAPPVLPA